LKRRSEDYLERQVTDIQQELNSLPTVSKLVSIIIDFEYCSECIVLGGFLFTLVFFLPYLVPISFLLLICSFTAIASITELFLGLLD